jgi:hypothetical protein
MIRRNRNPGRIANAEKEIGYDIFARVRIKQSPSTKPLYRAMSGKRLLPAHTSA